MKDDLRAKLDTASLMPRGKWKELWVAAADEFCAPAKPHVDRALSDVTTDGAQTVRAFLENPQGELPRASWLTWSAELKPWDALERNERNSVKARAKALVESISKTADPELVVPVFLAGLRQEWRTRHLLERARWHEAHPLAVSIFVNCVRLPGPPHDELRDAAFFSLGRVRELPTEARGALWLLVWSDSRYGLHRWDTLARLREPGAIAAGLADAWSSLDSWEPTPALTRALIRVVLGEDPFLARRREADYPEGPTNAEIVARAVEMLPRVAIQTELVPLAREALDGRWASFGLVGAIARGLLGCADAVPALTEALTADTTARALRGLTAIGTEARSALEKIRAGADSVDRSLALAAIDPTPESLDALIAVCARCAEQAAEVRLQYEEGLINGEEYARYFDPAALAVRLWSQHGSTPEREAMRRRLASTLAEHEVIRADVAIKRLLDAAAT